MADINDNERVVKDFFFKQLRKVAVGGLAVPDDARASLLACSSLYGLTFLATSSGVCVFETAVLVSVDTAPTYGSKNTPADLSLLQATHIPTPTVPLYLSLSSDSLTLCVAWRVNGILSLNFYDTKAVVLAKSSPVQPFCSISPTTEPGVGVSGVQWNPGSPELLAVVLSSGALYVLEVKEDVKVVASEVDMGAASLCWSPKGKQLALGVKDGCIVQYSHKTHGVKQRHACPDTFRGVPQQVTGVQWVSTYMFAAVYTPTAGSDHTPTFLFLSTPKNGPAVWSNWEDVYYGEGRRADKFHFIHLSLWNMLLTSSGNGMETVVFNQLPGEVGWERWDLEDSGRAEVPLADGKETYVAGMALSLCSQCDVQISDVLTIPPSPLLLLYSTAGILCPFWVVHQGKSPEELATIMTPPTPLPPGPPRLPTPLNTPATVAQISVADTKSDVGTHFSTAAILAAATPSTGSLLIPATPALPHTLATFSSPRPSSAAALQQPPQLQSVCLPSWTPLQTPRPPPPTGVAPLPAARPPPPTGVAPLLATRPPPPTGVAPLPAARPPPPTGVAPPLAAHPPFPTSVAPPAAHPPFPTSVAPPLVARPPPPTGVAPPPAAHPPFPTSVAPPLVARPPPPTGVAPPPAAHPPFPTSATPLLAAHPPPPTSATPLLAAHPPPPTSATPLLAAHPPPPTSATPLLAAHPPPPTSATPLLAAHPPPPTGVAPLQGITVRPLSTSIPQQTLPSIRPTVTGGVPQVSVMRPLLANNQLPISNSSGTPVPQLLSQQLQAPTSAGPGVGVASSQPSPASGAAMAARPLETHATGPPPRDDAMKVEATFSSHIADEIEKFADELEDFKEEIESVLGALWEEGEEEGGGRSVGGLGTLQDAVEVREETEEVGAAVCEALRTVKELTEGCDQLRDEVLRGLELSEKARVSIKRTSDREYALRQQVRPLDPANMRKLHNIRKLFLEVDQKIGEVNGQLDAEVERRRMNALQRGRSPLRPPSIQTVYSSVRDHHKILRLQEERAAKIVCDMKRLRFIPLSWTPEDVQNSTLSRATPTQLQGERGRKETRSPQPEKLDKLREYLRNIEEIPVCRVRPKAFVRRSIALSGTSSPTTSQFTNTEHSQAGSYIGSGRSSPTSSHPDYMVSGSKPRLHQKSMDGYVMLSLTSTPLASAQASSVSLPQNTEPAAPTPPSTETLSSSKPGPPTQQYLPSPSSAVSTGGIGSSHTVAWGAPSTANVQAASHECVGGLRRVEGQTNLASASLPYSSSLQSTTVQPTFSNTPVVLPFSLSLLSSTLGMSKPPLSGPVVTDDAKATSSGAFSGLATAADKLAVPTPPISSAFNFGKLSEGHTVTTQGSLFTFGASITTQSFTSATKLATTSLHTTPLQTSLKTVFSSPSFAVSPMPSQVTAVSTSLPTHSSPFMFTAPTIHTATSLPGRPPISIPSQSGSGQDEADASSSPLPPATTSTETACSASISTETSTETMKERTGLSGLVVSAPSTSGPVLPTTMMLRSSTTGYTNIMPSGHGSFAASSTSGFTASSSHTSSQLASTFSQLLPHTAPPVIVVATTIHPVSATSTAPPIAVVASATPPVAVVASATPPVAVVASATPPVAVVASATPPVAVVASATPPVGVAASSKPPMASTTPSVAVVASTLPVVVVSTSAVTAPLLKSATPSVSAGASTPHVAPALTGTEEQEMEDAMEQADIGLQSTATTSVEAGGLFGGGLGSIGLGAPPRITSAANPFGSVTQSMVSTSTASSLLSSEPAFGGNGGGGGGSQPPFSLTSQPQFGQSPSFGQQSIFGASTKSGIGGPSLGGGPPPFTTSSFGGMFGSNVAGTGSSENLSFGALASQGHAGFAGQAQQGSGFNSGLGGSGFGTPPMAGSSFSGWRH